MRKANDQLIKEYEILKGQIVESTDNLELNKKNEMFEKKRNI